MLPFFASRQPAIVAMEACGSSHHWARQLARLGHQVRLLATKFVKPSSTLEGLLPKPADQGAARQAVRQLKREPAFDCPTAIR